MIKMDQFPDDCLPPEHTYTSRDDLFGQLIAGRHREAMLLLLDDRIKASLVVTVGSDQGEAFKDSV
jgi:hypothetical protein